MADGSVLSVGTFDGFHRGHRAILEAVREIAQSNGLRSAVLAFETPPRRILEHQVTGSLLLPRGLKRKLLSPFVDEVIPVCFSELQALEPPEFIAYLRQRYPGLHTIVEGQSFRFGSGRAGGLDTLVELGTVHGFSLEVVPPIMVGNAPASSSRIRQALAHGDLPLATEMLGRPPALFGHVIHGDGKGKTFGFPTANLAIEEDVLRPASGIYLVRAFVPNAAYNGLLYVGNRPSLVSNESRCEVHLLSAPDRPLYGACLEVHLVRRLRADRAFPSLGALQEQMGKDVETARALFENAPCSSKRLIQ